MLDDELELTLLENVEALQSVLVARATGGSADDRQYKRVRAALLEEESVATALPSFVRTCRDLSQFWAYISKVGGYAERRKHIWDALEAAHEAAQGRVTAPAAKQLSDTLEALSLEEVNRIWLRGLERLPEDARGAITVARTLLETTCKYILDAQGVEYDDTAEFPKLYRLVAQCLRLAPEQSTEQLFKQVLGACHTVVEGVAAIRNKLSDAHGRGVDAAAPEERHARLALNLAGSAALFLVATWHSRDARR